MLLSLITIKTPTIQKENRVNSNVKKLKERRSTVLSFILLSWYKEHACYGLKKLKVPSKEKRRTRVEIRHLAVSGFELDVRVLANGKKQNLCWKRDGEKDTSAGSDDLHTVVAVIEEHGCLEKWTQTVFHGSSGVGVSIGRGRSHAFHSSGIVIPVNLEPGHTGVGCQDVALQPIKVRRGGRVFLEFGVGILVVDVVAHPDELLASVRACQQHHCHAHCVLNRDLAWIWGLSLEDEHVSPFWNGTHVDGVEDLVIIFALRGAHVYYFPLQIFFEIFDTLESYFELERVDEQRGVVQHDHVADVNFGHSAIESRTSRL